MALKHALLSWLPLVIVPLTASGCVFAGGNDNYDTTSSSGGNTTDQDVAQYDSIQAKLEQQRSVFKKRGAGELAGVDTRLFWGDVACARGLGARSAMVVLFGLAVAVLFFALLRR